MKQRMGFVSNSSTTSFSIYGVLARQDNLKITCEAKKRYELATHIRKIIAEKKLILRIEFGQTDDIYVGANFEDMLDNETKREFYDKVDKQLQEIFIDVIPQWYEESWYDG
jgi:hypothetical protein